MKIAIVGSAPSSMQLAPFNDPEWEIWGLNEQYNLMPRWDRWFQLHPLNLCKTGLADPNHWEWLIAQTKPVYMVDAFPEVPACIKYPLEEVLKRFGDYFTNSISYMIAYALYLHQTFEPVEEMGVWGVDMAHCSEYGDQKASCEYFIGLARGMGIPCHIPPEAELCKTPYLYGFEQMPDVLWKTRARLLELKGRMEHASQETRIKEVEAAYLKGAYEDCEYFYKNWAINGSLQKPI